MIVKGIDYKALDYTDPIPGSVLKANGITEVFRYITNPSWPKSLSKPEVDDLRANAIKINLNYEETADFMLSGYSGGIRCAQYARSLANGLGFSQDAPIYYSTDFDVSDAQITTVLDFLYGAEFQDKARYRVGLYGGYKACKAAAQHGYGVWQTDAWSYGQREPSSVAYQTGGQVVIAGVNADLNLLNSNVIGSNVPVIPSSIGNKWPSIASEFTGTYDDSTAIIWADAGARYAAEQSDKILAAVNSGKLSDADLQRIITAVQSNTVATIGSLSDIDVQRVAHAVVALMGKDLANG